MLKSIHVAALLGLLSASLACAQTTIGHSATLSGRLSATAGVDAEFGTTSFIDTNFTANSTTLGDNGTNNKFQTIFAFEVSNAWLADYSAVESVTFSFRISGVNAGGGTPAAIEVLLLGINDGTSNPWSVASSAPLLTSLGSVSGTAIANHTINLTSAITAAGTQPSGTNRFVWIGLDGGFSNNSTANNVLLNMTNTSFQLPALTVTAIPEPSTAAIGVGIAALLVVTARRRRRQDHN